MGLNIRIPHKWALVFCGYAALGALLYGYDGTYWTGSTAMTALKRDFGYYDAATDSYRLTTSFLSLTTSLVYVGELVGSFTAPAIQERFGRKGGMAAAMVGTILGVIIQLCATHQMGVIIAGRIFLGYGVGMVSNAVPQYLSEVSPDSIRGSVVGSWQLTLAFGQIVGAVVSQGTHNINSSAAYRIPIALPLVVPILVAVGYPFVPESPRWLVGAGKTAKAEVALRKINREKLTDPASAYDVQTELAMLKRQADVENSREPSSWLALLRNPVERRKLACVVLILAGQQFTAVQPVFSYLSVFLQQIGVEDAFLWTIIVDIFELLGVIVSFFLVNRIGRRKMLLSTTVVMALCYFVSAALVTQSDPPYAQKLGVVVCYMVYVFAFNLAFGPLAWTCAAELCPGPNKQKIFAVGTAAFWVTAWLFTFTSPYIFDSGAGSAGLGGMDGWIYGGCCVVVIGIVYFAIPETLGRTLEEIDALFELRVATRQWAGYVLPASSSANTVVSSTEKLGRDSESSDRDAADLKKGTDHAESVVV